MRSITTFTLLLIQVFITCGQKTDAPPTIENVVKEFYKKYASAEYTGLITFEKRMNDWYVVSNIFKNLEVIPETKYLFYNGKTKKFQKLQFNQNKQEREVKVTDHIPEYDIKNYDLQPYYGYSGWYKDVIKEYESKPKLSDNELYGLARAYSTQAGSLVADLGGYAIKNEIWSIPLNINGLSPSRIDSFVKIDNNAILNFKKLADSNPGYETIVGKIGFKYANEVMFQYQSLLAYADNYAKKFTFPPNLYSDQQLEIPKKLLESCPQNAIFVSFGDNDYYPIHYLQNIKGIRKDVYLVNYSLLGIDRYILRATFPQYDALPIDLGVDTSFYSRSTNDLILIKDSSFLLSINEFKFYLQKGQQDEFGRIILAADKIDLAGTKQKKGNAEKVMSLKKVNYLLKNQWILLNIIGNLNGRKICFPNILLDEIKELNNHLLQKDNIWIYDN
jgi:hypothetical protein